MIVVIRPPVWRNGIRSGLKTGGGPAFERIAKALIATSLSATSLSASAKWLPTIPPQGRTRNLPSPPQTAP
jgi:hypothetical protein